MTRRKCQTDERKKNSRTNITGLKNNSPEYQRAYYKERMENAGFEVRPYQRSGIELPSSDPQWFREWRKINKERKVKV